MNRRQMIQRSGLTLGVVAVSGPSVLLSQGCKVDKDKAVRYTGIVINYLKDALPLVGGLGGTELAQLINRTIPLLEKLKDAIDNAELPTAGDLFTQVTAVLGQVANALFQLPESARRDTVIGIIGLVNLTLRTVQLFVESETPAVASGPRRAMGAVYKPSATALAVRRAFEASRF